jgi:hypothetical protein
MMPIDLDKVRERHLTIEFLDGHKECSCGKTAPCDASQLADEVERLRADNSRLRDELAQAWGLTDADTEAARTAEIKGLRKALDTLNTKKDKDG